MTSKLTSYEKILRDLQTIVGPSTGDEPDELASHKSLGQTALAELSQKMREVLVQNEELKKEVDAVNRKLKSSAGVTRVQESVPMRMSTGVLPASTVQSEENSLDEPTVHHLQTSDRERELTQNLMNQIDTYLDMKNRIEESKSLNSRSNCMIEIELLDEIDQLLSQV